jgi:hypothetical protein
MRNKIDEIMKQIGKINFYDEKGKYTPLNELPEGEYILKYSRTPEKNNSSIPFDTKNIERILKIYIDLESFPFLEILENKTQEIILKNRKRWEDSFIVRELKDLRYFVGI